MNHCIINFISSRCGGLGPNMGISLFRLVMTYINVEWILIINDWQIVAVNCRLVIKMVCHFEWNIG